MREDYFTNTEADAGKFARHYAEPYDDDRPSPSDLAEDAQAFVDAREGRAVQAGLWVYPDHWPERAP